MPPKAILLPCFFCVVFKTVQIKKINETSHSNLPKKIDRSHFNMLKIDNYLPVYDFSERHSIFIKCTPDIAYNALKELDFSKSTFIRFLFRLRGLKSDNFQKLQERFVLLHNDSNKEIILGLIARPWKLNGAVFHTPKIDFQRFNESDYAKIVWNFAFEQHNENKTLVSTETRILCTDDESRKKFKLYWFFVRPLSGLVRKEILKMLQKNVET